MPGTKERSGDILASGEVEAESIKIATWRTGWEMQGNLLFFRETHSFQEQDGAFIMWPPYLILIQRTMW